MDLHITQDGHVGLLEIRRPPANFFDRQLIEELANAMETLVQGGSRSLLLCSAGKHFCAGADFSDEGDEDRTLRSLTLYRAAARFFRIPVPIVAAVQGAAVGGGLGLALAADFRVASPTSRFQANFVRLGFHPGFGLSETLPHVVGPQAASRMMLTARTVRGEEAHSLGLVDELAPEEELRTRALTMANEIAGCAPLAVQSVKHTLRNDLAHRIDRALERELIEQTGLWKTEDSRLGIQASIQRTEPTFVGR